ncbi:unnamed protein product [Symbiodinium sp. CCMP2592]|nr:unnamed protein product [Symbiodinium sp. CCMP2592]
MLRVRSCGGHIICTIQPGTHTKGTDRILDDLARTVAIHLRTPANRISIHYADGRGSLSPTTTWADCAELAVLEDVELLAVARHFKAGGGEKLAVAIELERHDDVCSLLDSLVDPNIAIADCRNSWPCSPLCFAAYTNFEHVSIAETLVAAQADVDGRHFAVSPLLAACESRNTRMASFLIENQADVDRRSWTMESPLLVAVSMNSAPLVRLLLRHRANINHQDRYQRGPIERAFEHRAPLAAACLLHANARVQAYASANSLLHQAARRGSSTWIRLLIRAGLTIQNQDDRGRLPAEVRQRLPTFQQRYQLKRSLCTTATPTRRKQQRASSEPTATEKPAATVHGILRVQRSRTKARTPGKKRNEVVCRRQEGSPNSAPQPTCRPSKSAPSVNIMQPESRRRWADMTDDDDQAIGWDFETFKTDYLATRCSLTLLTPVPGPETQPTKPRAHAQRSAATTTKGDKNNAERFTGSTAGRLRAEPAAPRGGAWPDPDHEPELGPSIEEHFAGRLTRKKMTGDGNCLFHALAERSGENGLHLRAQIIQYLKENAASQEHEEQAEAWLEEAEHLESNRGNWGGDTAIVAFTLMRQQRAFLHWRASDGQINTIERTHAEVDEEARRDPRAAQNFTQAIHLWYARSHYDVLVPSQDHTEPPPPSPPLPPPPTAPEPPPSPHPEPRPAKRNRTRADRAENKQQAQARKAAWIAEPCPPRPEEGPSLMEDLTDMPVAPVSNHPRRNLEDALQHLANTQLRFQPLIPPEARAEELDSGEHWPRVFCAFKGCSWSSDTGTEQELHQHVKKAHGPALQSVAQHMPKPVPTDALTSVYNEAVALRCREAAPVAGSSRDRSALRSFAEATSKDKVESLICFSCACIHPHMADTGTAGRIHWRKLIHSPGSNDNSHIEGMELLHETLSIDKYLERYDDLGGGVSLKDVANFDDWTVTVPGFGNILCCPEDHRCHANPQHPTQHTLCEHCEVPICSDCAQHLSKGELPPLSLCNDMWTGYSPARLHEQKVTVMEMICASPCVTTLICMSMEARHRSEGTTLDEKAQNAGHRLGARGNALTFPLPWEDLLRSLQAHDAQVAKEQRQAAGVNGPETAAMPSFPRAGKALGDVVRVLLKTNKTGKTSEAEIKTLLHQATVRREVVVNLILDMQRLGHPAFQHLREAAVREAAEQLPEGSVPPEVLKVICGLSEEDETAHKLQPQKAAAPTDAPEQDTQRAGAIFADQRARAVVPEGYSQDREDQHAVATAALNDLEDQLRSKTENDKILETMEVRTGNIFVDQFQPYYFATAFSFCFAHGTACPDVQNSQAAPSNDERQKGRRRSRNPTAPQVQIHEWAAAMQRRVETQFRRDWTFGFTLWNYLFRTMVNTQQNAFMYSVPDENNGLRQLTSQEITGGMKQIQQLLSKGQYLDVNNQVKAIKGDLGKVRFAPEISQAALKAGSRNVCTRDQSSKRT